ncbi:hypothetical protein SSX86_011394 [Deinandra increscens subsp. villosa]|uniref:Uncharacterized protein n=1 Tax=Deinandra increscens subsp. villosa TaxID=3103831 RepID=A0AAP0D6F3_9ASTR
MRSESTSRKKPMMLVRIIKTPIQALQKAKDTYIKSMTSFSASYNRPRMIVEDANRLTELSTNHSGPQVRRGLTRASSFGKAELERGLIRKRDCELRTFASRKGMPKSWSVVMGRIDEDKVSSFREDIILFKKMVVVNSYKDSRLSRNYNSAGDRR